MRAIRLHAFGPAGNLRYEEVSDPEPGAGQVRIAVAAAGVHLIDTTIRAGVRMGPYPLPELPAIPGREVAGVIDAVGPEVEEGWLGRRVAAHLGVASAGYAELAVREVEHLHALPDGVGGRPSAQRWSCSAAAAGSSSSGSPPARSPSCRPATSSRAASPSPPRSAGSTACASGRSGRSAPRPRAARPRCQAGTGAGWVMRIPLPNGSRSAQSMP
jgi:Alcohol dehydrogenase GroES-like domain